MTDRLGPTRGSPVADNLAEIDPVIRRLPSESVSDSFTLSNVGRLSAEQSISLLQPPAPVSLGKRLIGYIKSNLPDLSFRTLGLGAGIGVGVSQVYSAVATGATLAGGMTSILGPLSGIHAITESLATWRRLSTLKNAAGEPIKVPVREKVARVFFENLAPCVIGAAVTTLMLGGAIVSAFITGGAASPLLGLAVLKSAPVYLATQRVCSKLGQFACNRMFEAREPSVLERTYQSVKQRMFPKVRPESDIGLNEADTDSISVSDLGSVEENVRSGVSKVFVESLHRPAGIPDPGSRVNNAWYRQMLAEDEKGDPNSKEDGQDAFRAMPSHEPLQLPSRGLMYRNVVGDGNCWITAANYAFLSHFVNNADYRADFLRAHSTPSDPKEIRFLNLLKEMDAYVAKIGDISDNQLMSLITSPAYVGVIRDFTRDLCKQPQQDAYGGADELEKFSEYIKLQLPHLVLKADRQRGEERILPQLPGSEPLDWPVAEKQLVLVSSSGSNHHYVILETEENNESEFKSAFSGRSATARSLGSDEDSESAVSGSSVTARSSQSSGRLSTYDPDDDDDSESALSEGLEPEHYIQVIAELDEDTSNEMWHDTYMGLVSSLAAEDLDPQTKSKLAQLLGEFRAKSEKIHANRGRKPIVPLNELLDGINSYREYLESDAGQAETLDTLRRKRRAMAFNLDQLRRAHAQVEGVHENVADFQKLIDLLNTRIAAHTRAETIGLEADLEDPRVRQLQDSVEVLGAKLNAAKDEAAAATRRVSEVQEELSKQAAANVDNIQAGALFAATAVAAQFEAEQERQQGLLRTAKEAERNALAKAADLTKELRGEIGELQQQNARLVTHYRSRLSQLENKNQQILSEKQRQVERLKREVTDSNTRGAKAKRRADEALTQAQQQHQRLNRQSARAEAVLRQQIETLEANSREATSRYDAAIFQRDQAFNFASQTVSDSETRLRYDIGGQELAMREMFAKLEVGARTAIEADAKKTLSDLASTKTEMEQLRADLAKEQQSMQQMAADKFQLGLAMGVTIAVGSQTRKTPEETIERNKRLQAAHARISELEMQIRQLSDTKYMPALEALSDEYEAKLTTMRKQLQKAGAEIDKAKGRAAEQATKSTLATLRAQAQKSEAEFARLTQESESIQSLIRQEADTKISALESTIDEQSRTIADLQQGLADAQKAAPALFAAGHASGATSAAVEFSRTAQADIVRSVNETERVAQRMAAARTQEIESQLKAVLANRAADRAQLETQYSAKLSNSLARLEAANKQKSAELANLQARLEQAQKSSNKAALKDAQNAVVAAEGRQRSLQSQMQSEINQLKIKLSDLEKQRNEMADALEKAGNDLIASKAFFKWKNVVEKRKLETAKKTHEAEIARLNAELATVRSAGSSLETNLENQIREQREETMAAYASGLAHAATFVDGLENETRQTLEVLEAETRSALVATRNRASHNVRTLDFYRDSIRLLRIDLDSGESRQRLVTNEFIEREKSFRAAIHELAERITQLELQLKNSTGNNKALSEQLAQSKTIAAAVFSELEGLARSHAQSSLFAEMGAKLEVVLKATEGAARDALVLEEQTASQSLSTQAQLLSATASEERSRQGIENSFNGLMITAAEGLARAQNVEQMTASLQMYAAPLVLQLQELAARQRGTASEMEAFNQLKTAWDMSMSDALVNMQSRAVEAEGPQRAEIIAEEIAVFQTQIAAAFEEGASRQQVIESRQQFIKQSIVEATESLNRVKTMHEAESALKKLAQTNLLQLGEQERRAAIGSAAQVKLDAEYANMQAAMQAMKSRLNLSELDANLRNHMDSLKEAFLESHAGKERVVTEDTEAALAQLQKIKEEAIDLAIQELADEEGTNASHVSDDEMESPRIEAPKEDDAKWMPYVEAGAALPQYLLAEAKARFLALAERVDIDDTKKAEISKIAAENTPEYRDLVGQALENQMLFAAALGKLILRTPSGRSDEIDTAGQILLQNYLMQPKLKKPTRRIVISAATKQLERVRTSTSSPQLINARISKMVLPGSMFGMMHSLETVDLGRILNTRFERKYNIPTYPTPEEVQSAQSRVIEAPKLEVVAMALPDVVAAQALQRKLMQSLEGTSLPPLPILVQMLEEGSLDPAYFKRFADGGLSILQNAIYPYYVAELRIRKGAETTTFFDKPATANDLTSILPVHASPEEQVSLILRAIAIMGRPLNKNGLGGSPFSEQQIQQFRRMSSVGMQATPFQGAAGSGKSKSIGLYPELTGTDLPFILHISPFPERNTHNWSLANLPTPDTKGTPVIHATIDELTRWLGVNPKETFGNGLVVLDEYDSARYIPVRKMLLERGKPAFEMSATRNKNDIESVRARNDYKLRLLDALPGPTRSDLAALTNPANRADPNYLNTYKREAFIKWFDEKYKGQTSVDANVAVEQFITQLTEKRRAKVAKAKLALKDLSEMQDLQFKRSMTIEQGSSNQLIQKAVQFQVAIPDKNCVLVELPEEETPIEQQADNAALRLMAAIETNPDEKNPDSPVGIAYRDSSGRLLYKIWRNRSWTTVPEKQFSEEPLAKVYCLYTKDSRGGDFRQYSRERVGGVFMHYNSVPLSDELYQNLGRDRNKVTVSSAPVTIYLTNRKMNQASLVSEAKEAQQSSDADVIELRAKERVIKAMKQDLLNRAVKILGKDPLVGEVRKALENLNLTPEDFDKPEGQPAALLRKVYQDIVQSRQAKLGGELIGGAALDAALLAGPQYSPGKTIREMLKLTNIPLDSGDINSLELQRIELVLKKTPANMDFFKKDMLGLQQLRNVNPAVLMRFEKGIIETTAQWGERAAYYAGEIKKLRDQEAKRKEQEASAFARQASRATSRGRPTTPGGRGMSRNNSLAGQTTLPSPRVTPRKP
ncbi:MAG: hypothetical protein V4534_01690 [Myxococcota bacterium]